MIDLQKNHLSIKMWKIFKKSLVREYSKIIDSKSETLSYIQLSRCYCGILLHSSTRRSRINALEIAARCITGYHQRRK